MFNTDRKKATVRTEFDAFWFLVEFVFVDDCLGDHTDHQRLAILIGNHQQTAVWRDVQGCAIVATFKA
jgi:hypothetical protein